MGARLLQLAATVRIPGIEHAGAQQADRVRLDVNGCPWVWVWVWACVTGWDWAATGSPVLAPQRPATQHRPLPRL